MRGGAQKPFGLDNQDCDGGSGSLNTVIVLRQEVIRDSSFAADCSRLVTD